MTHLLVMRPGAIGDSLLALPVVKAMRACHPDVRVTFASNPAILPLVQDAALAETVSDYSSALWSDLFSTDGVQRSDLRNLLRQVDRAICWLRDPDDIVKHNLRTQGIEQSIIAPGRPSEETGLHIVDYLARTIWPDPPPLTRDIPILPPYAEHSNKEPARIAIHPSRDGACPHPAQSSNEEPARIAIHPGSGGTYKCWPVAHFATVISALWRRAIPVLLLAGEADSEVLAALLSRLPHPPDAALLTVLHNAPLRTVAREIQQCRGYLGNDSGISHLAALCGVPTLVLFGPTSPATWRPFGRSVEVLFERELANLQPETVLYTIEKFFYLIS